MIGLIDVIDGHGAATPEKLAFSGFGGEMTYGELTALTCRVGNQLQTEGFAKGVRFAIYTPNCGLGVAAQLGALRMGGVWCNVNLRNTIEDNASILARGECGVLFYHSSVEADALKVAEGAPSIRLKVCLDKATDAAPSLLEWCAKAAETPPQVAINEREEIGLQGNTGGTTGLPKLTQNPYFLLTKNAQVFAEIMPVEGEMRNLAVAPITHAGGILCHGVLYAGGTTVMMATADPKTVLDALERERITTLFLPPTLVYMLLAQPDVAERDYSALRYILSAGAPIAPPKVEEANRVFGSVICNALGQTESGFPLTFISPAEMAEAVTDPAKRHRLASCGRPVSVVDRMEIMDDAGNLLPRGEKGEIVLQGPCVMQEYLNDPEATAEVKRFGWQHTGDVGYIDDEGYLYVNDRKRDMIISGGFNIFPFEVEQALLSYPGLKECAVVGLPDEKWGERVTAVVELAPGAKLDEAAIIAHCKDKIGSMKAPKQVVAVELLPRSAVGKVLKREIRKSLAG